MQERRNSISNALELRLVFLALSHLDVASAIYAPLYFVLFCLVSVISSSLCICVISNTCVTAMKSVVVNIYCAPLELAPLKVKDRFAIWDEWNSFIACLISLISFSRKWLIKQHDVFRCKVVRWWISRTSCISLAINHCQCWILGRKQKISLQYLLFLDTVLTPVAKIPPCGRKGRAYLTHWPLANFNVILKCNLQSCFTDWYRQTFLW